MPSSELRRDWPRTAEPGVEAQGAAKPGDESSIIRCIARVCRGAGGPGSWIIRVPNRGPLLRGRLLNAKTGRSQSCSAASSWIIGMALMEGIDLGSAQLPDRQCESRLIPRSHECGYRPHRCRGRRRRRPLLSHPQGARVFGGIVDHRCGRGRAVANAGSRRHPGYATFRSPVDKLLA